MLDPMTMLALALSVPTAHALECGAGEYAAEVAQGLSMASDTLTIGPGCDVRAQTEIRSASDLTITCAVEGCDLPPIAAYDSTLSVVGGQLSSTAAFFVRSPYDGLDGDSGLVPEQAGIYAERSFLTVEDVGATELGAATAAVFAWDSHVDVLGGKYKDLGGAGISVLSYAEQIRVTVTGTEFEGAGGFGVRADGSYALARGGVVSLTVDGATFANMTTQNGDIYAAVESFTHSNTVHYRSFAKSGSPVEVMASSVTISHPEFVQTHGEGGSATFFIFGADDVSVDGGTFQPAEGSTYSFKVYESGRLRVSGGLWEPMNTVVMSASTVTVSGVRFRLPEREEESTLLASADSELTFESNSVCAEGPRVGTYGPLFDFYQVDATFDQNVFQRVDLGDLTFMELDGSSLLTVTDNTFVNVNAGPLVDAELTELDFRNNLLYGTSPDFTTDTMPSQLTTGFNLLYSESRASWPSWWPATGQVTGTPVFIDGYSANCEEVIDGVEPPLGPAPADGSPVIDAGDPGLPDSADGTPSDIGAIDYNHPVGEPEDTGGLGDTGDSGDGSGGGNVDLPGEVQYGGGCAFGGWGIAAAPLVLFWRRRRPGAAMRG